MGDPINVPAAPGNTNNIILADNVQGPHPNPITLWASGCRTPLPIEDDARLDPEGSGDQPFGQDGWRAGFVFKDFEHLGNLLSGEFSLPSFVCKNNFLNCGPIEENQVQWLAILAHGGPGGLDIDGKFGRDFDAVATDPTLLNVGTLSRYSKQFDQILKVLAFRAKVFFMCCRTGAGPAGDEFLKAVSNLWAAKEVFVVGYRSVLYCNGGAQARHGSGGSCFPGARETHYSNVTDTGNTAKRDYMSAAAWNDLSVLPWASEKTMHASMAWRGMLLKTGMEPYLP